MNRLGITITSTYWTTAAAAAAGTAALTVLSRIWPVHILWTILIFVLLTVLGKIAARSCSSPTEGFPIGRAFLWSYISYVTGSIAAAAILNLLGWIPEFTMPNMEFSQYSYGDFPFLTGLPSVIQRFMDFLQSGETMMKLQIASALYSGAIMSLLAGAVIKINKRSR